MIPRVLRFGVLTMTVLATVAAGAASRSVGGDDDQSVGSWVVNSPAHVSSGGSAVGPHATATPELLVNGRVVPITLEKGDAVLLTAVPYCARANRGRGEMAVWIHQGQ